MALNLKIDLNVLERTIQTYENQIDEFVKARNDVLKALQLLKSSGWDTGSSKVWFELMDTGWLDSMAYHTRVIGELRKELEIARRNYEEVLEEQERLARNL